MAKKVTSIIMIVSLSLSMVFGGLGLSLHFANADTPSSTYAYIGDFLKSCKDMDFIKNNASYLAQVESYETYVNTNFNSEFFVAIKQGNNYCFASYYNQDSSHRFALWSSQTLFGAANQAYYYRTSYLMVSGDNSICALSLSTSSRLNQESGALNFTSSSIQTRCCPNKANFDVSGREVYFNQNIYGQYGSGKVYDYNLLEGSSAPVIFDFELYTFWIGSRLYLTLTDQLLVRELYGNELMEYVLFCTYDNEANSEDFITKAYTFLDCSLLQYTGIESNLTNVSPQGVYAIDITEIGYNRISDAIIEDYTEDFAQVGQAANVPYILQEESPEPGTNGTPDSYTNSWSTFITYINNYDSTQVIPDNLVDTIFGVNGFKLYPVDVSLPSSTIPGNNAFTPGIHTYKYHFSSLPADLGLNYDLMDVCIIPKTFTGNYGLVFFYDDTLAAANKFVDYVDYKDLLEQFDLIIVIDDTLEALQENAWWEIIVPNDVWSHIDYMAVSGSSSLGIEYTSDPLPGNIESGFCIVTKRAIQRQQLYLFNDGITKSYKLMSDFVEKHGLWENSFFEWSQSIFYQLQTIGGRTNDIYNLLVGLNLGDVLDNISRQLERIADNTSEEDPGYWFLSLFNFISRFSVSDLDFANWVEDYDDFESQIPMPNEDVTPIPIPTITSEVG